MTSSHRLRNQGQSGPTASFLALRARLFRACWVLAALSVLACEPDAFLGTDKQDPGTSGVGGTQIDAGGGESLEDHPDEEPQVIEKAGGAASTELPNDTTFIQGHECSVVHPGESHDEPIAVCCQMSAEEDAWRDEAVVEINAARADLGLEPFERDPALDRAAMAWAMHWHLHWDPIEKAGYPVNYTVPSDVAAECGTTATTLVMTNTQSEPRFANDLIDPSIPAERWQASNNFRFEDPNYVRIGIGFYDGLLLGLFDRVEAP